MLFATRDTNLVPARPGQRGICPECASPVIAKCGPIVIWHWAHQAASPTCRYHEETEWHLRWKQWALEQGCRVEVPTANRRHRADIVAPNGTIIELQTRALAEPQLRAREHEYGPKLVWVYRITEEQQARLHWTRELGTGMGFYFERGPKLMTLPTAPIYFDLDDGHSDDIQKVRLTLKTKTNPQWGTYETVLGIAWDASRSDLIGQPTPHAGRLPDQLQPESANYRALMAMLGKARENNEPWYVWIAEGHHKNQPRQPVPSQPVTGDLA